MTCDASSGDTLSLLYTDTNALDTAFLRRFGGWGLGVGGWGLGVGGWSLGFGVWGFTPPLQLEYQRRWASGLQYTHQHTGVYTCECMLFTVVRVLFTIQYSHPHYAEACGQCLQVMVAMFIIIGMITISAMITIITPMTIIITII